MALGYFGAQTSGFGSWAQTARSSYEGRLLGFSVALSARVRGDQPFLRLGRKSLREGAGCVFLAVLSPSCWLRGSRAFPTLRALRPGRQLLSRPGQTLSDLIK